MKTTDVFAHLICACRYILFIYLDSTFDSCLTNAKVTFNIFDLSHT